ncbi:MAG: cache domain-containing protein, partial [Opitutaceae bacterium]|nr:cache domain-containing protein [Opitutaceae bacterium]
MLLGMTGVVLAAMGLLGALLNRQSRQMAEELAGVLLAQKIQQVESRIQHLIGSAERQARLCAQLTPPGGLESRDFVATFGRLAAGFLLQGDFTYLGYAVESTGEYGFLERRDATTCRFREYVRLPSGERVIRIYAVEPHGLVLQQTLPWDGYDPRERPFYAAARASDGPAWTPTYVFKGNDWHPETLGVTHVLPVRDAQGALLGVWDVDFDMQDLSAFLRKEASDQTGYAFVMEASERADPVLIAHPEMAEVSLAQGMTSPLDPVLQPAVRPGETGVVSRDFRVEAEAGVRLIACRLLASPSWIVAVVFDEAAALARLEDNRRWVWLLVLGVTAAAVLTAAWLAHALWRPVEQLRSAVEAL